MSMQNANVLHGSAYATTLIGRFFSFILSREPCKCESVCGFRVFFVRFVWSNWWTSVHSIYIDWGDFCLKTLAIKIYSVGFQFFSLKHRTHGTATEQKCVVFFSMFCESSRFIDYSHEIRTGRRMVCSVQQQHVQEMCGQHFASLFEFHSKPYLLLFVHREQRQSRNNLRTMLIVFALRIFINFFLSICFWFGSVESCCNMSKYVQNGRNSLSLTANTGTWTWTWTNEKLQRSTWLFDLTHTHAHILSISLAKHWYPITHKIGSYIFSNIFSLHRL